jgi:aspartyl-tRNA(Asn)/glutamyl-tRNA(Gln) amidotransferase subunit A
VTNLADLTATELLDLYRSGAASPVEAVRDCLARIELLEPRVNAVLHLRAEACLAEAERSAGRYRDGTAGALDGVPYGLKDIIYTAGVPTTGGSKIYGDHVPTETAALAERLAAAGGLLLAKLQTYEFAFGGEINTHYGPMPNPWDLERTSGGSSSGSGAALAARYVPLTVGTDTGGSIRVPASFCGISGLKATFGRVPRHGVMPLSWTLDNAGPMARSAADCALMLGVMAGADPRDPTSLEAPVGDYLSALAEDLSGVRIGVPTDWFFAVCDPQVEAAARAAIEVMAEAGAEIVEVALPHADLSEIVCWTIMYAEAASLHEITFDRLGDYDTRFAERLVACQFVSATDYLHALRARSVLQRDYEAAFERVDAIVSPGSPVVAPRLDGMLAEVGDELVSWLEVCARCTMPYNVTGMPALSIPSGLDRRGMPMGISIAARPLDEATCFRVGHAFQTRTAHHRLVPPLVAGAATAVAS